MTHLNELTNIPGRGISSFVFREGGWGPPRGLPGAAVGGLDAAVQRAKWEAASRAAKPARRKQEAAHRGWSQKGKARRRPRRHHQPTLNTVRPGPQNEGVRLGHVVDPGAGVDAAGLRPGRPAGANARNRPASGHRLDAGLAGASGYGEPALGVESAGRPRASCWKRIPHTTVARGGGESARRLGASCWERSPHTPLQRGGAAHHQQNGRVAQDGHPRQ
jgi:hypothetical protein